MTHTSVGSSHVPFFRFDNLLEQLTRFRETLDQFIIKDQVKRYIVLEGSFSVNVPNFPNEAAGTCSFEVLTEQNACWKSCTQGSFVLLFFSNAWKKSVLVLVKISNSIIF